MAEKTVKKPESEAPVAQPQDALEGGAYEIIRRRLQQQATALDERLNQLNAARRDVFGAVETRLLGTERILTANNCVPRDMVAIGSLLLFGYNVQLGLRKDMALADVFAIYAEQPEKGFAEQPLDLIEDAGFQRDFTELYRYYKNTTFVKFAELGPHLFMVFRVGRGVGDVKTFKWLVGDDGTLRYIDNRSEHEYRFPSQHEFEWIKAGRDMHRSGTFPHISIRDRIFVETSHGDLTIKIEDNTSTGEGIYAEPVEDPDQTLDDAEISFAEVGHLILLRVKPYREEAFRHIVYSEKAQTARRVDAIAEACVLLPEDHGIIFSNGYFLQTGEYKQFENGLTDMVFDRRLVSPNGEDYLYIFYNRDSGVYVLLSYNIIEQRVDTPIECNGYSLFADGRLMYFRAQEEPTKSHVVQIWQTAYASAVESVSKKHDSMLFKIGNRDIVRCMAGCRTLLGLLRREDSYANLYMDIMRQATDLLDSYFWIKEEAAFNPAAVLSEIKAAAAAAIDEFERVVQLRTAAAGQLGEQETATQDLMNRLRLARHADIRSHVDALASLRELTGKVIGLRDVRYMDLVRVDALEKTIKEWQDRQARDCVAFLLQDDAMAPYSEHIAAMEARVPGVEKVTEAEALRQEAEAASGQLEMLIETVTNLKIDDATKRTAIIESISVLFAGLNRLRAALQNRRKQLGATEGAAEFASQLKLLDQAVVNYLDVCDTPAKCEDYLSRVMIQLEELEGRFAEFDEYIAKLGDQRETVYNAFETRRLGLIEARNKRADTLMNSAVRILSSIRARVSSMKAVDQIHGYFASDMMIERLRGLVAQLVELEDPVKADDIQTRLKSLREDAVRQLHDRQELFVGGENVIKFGRHQFSVNTQALDLTIVPRGETMMLHLTGTNFFEAVADPEFLATRDAWGQETVSETADVYRGEYLAYRMLLEAENPDSGISLDAKAPLSPAELLEKVRTFMAPRYAEGYQKGIHDEDGTALLLALLEIRSAIGRLRYPGRARALALVFWQWFADQDGYARMQARLAGFGESNRVFRGDRRDHALIRDLETLISAFAVESRLFDAAFVGEAAAYLFEIVSTASGHPSTAEAAALCRGFEAHLKKLAAAEAFAAARARLAGDSCACFALVREWLAAFVENNGIAAPGDTLEEAAALLATDAFDHALASAVKSFRVIEGLRGNHPRIVEGRLELDFSAFVTRLKRFVMDVVPRFERCALLKKELLARSREAMRLEEFKPHVMTSFVRNQLIDRVYLPLCGDNLAKQIGTVGKTTRTDRSGMLMLISPPGYGKTTLMEYICNRLGLVFMKINGPAIGHLVTSLDPAEAPNAAAREELHKLGLALEMGDNVMLYVDDIQHCNPEFLQKFISLCDAQRKIEGVYKGRTRTYDMRGKKVAVVMAGNPYTESGEKFRIPDMLANRADIYNLGDILGDHDEPFKLSFLENALTSNPVLQKLAAGHRKDVYGVIRMAESGSSDGIELEGRYGNEELSEMLSVMKKLLRVRDVVLRVNEEYIRSAGQQDDFRTEPAFRLQGSYRNMNRMAAKVESVMNDRELETMIYSEYENEAQTLTTGAEANLLKFKEILGLLDQAELDRWNEIKRTYARHQMLRGAKEGDPASLAVAQLAGVGQGLSDIRDLIKEGVRAEKPSAIQTALTDDTLGRLEKMLAGMKPPAAKAVAETRLAAETWEKLSSILQEKRQAEMLETRYQRLSETCRKWREEFLIPLKKQCNDEPTQKSITVHHLDSVLTELDAFLDMGD
jgi:hypothetical protein